MIGTIVLDFDGVLAESNQAKSAAFEDFFALYPSQAAAMRAYHLEHYATSRMAKFGYYIDELMGRHGDAGLLETMTTQFSGLVKGRVIAAPDVPGARELLEEFSQRLPLYIASVTPQEELREIVEARGIAPYFKEVFGNPPVQKVDAIREIVTREGLQASQVVFIGDSASDYQTARETGVEFIGRDSGFGFSGAPIPLYKDLFAIAGILRERMKGKA